MYIIIIMAIMSLHYPSHILYYLAAPPQFNTVLLPNTVVVQNDYVVFKCEAQGYPAPTISWEHGGQIVTNDSPSFVVNSTLSQKGLTKITTSYLKISSVDVSMVGEVKCIANPPAARDIGEIALDTISTSTQLTVLGNLVCCMDIYRRKA